MRTQAPLSHPLAGAHAPVLELPPASLARLASAALNAVRVLDVPAGTPARPDSRAPCRCRHLRALPLLSRGLSRGLARGRKARVGGIWGLLVPCIVLPALAGCGGALEGDAGPVVVDITSVVVEMSSNANDDWPARVDLVRVDDAGIYARVIAVNPAEWFDGEGRRKFEDAHPQAYLDRWEIVPGTSIGPYDLGIFDDVAAVLLCDVESAPPPKAVAREGDLRIVVTDAGCEIREQD